MTDLSFQAAANAEDNRADLAALIDPWLQHMRWRADFADWRHKRLHSEQFQDETLGLITQVVGTLAGKQLLDLGCGMGGFAVAAELAGADVTALDYNPAYCVITAARGDQYGLQMPVMRAAGEALPCPDATYNIVTAWDVIEHVQQPSTMLSEIARVLQPGGVVFITAINRFAFRDPHYHLPLINYLPRPLAEFLIASFGRSKRRAAFRDRQRLSEMHYYSYAGFARAAARYGLRTRDLDEERVLRGDLAPHRKIRRRVLQLFDRHGLTLTLYHLYRALYQGTYRLVLVKDGADG
jgi:ubiquinone/menaquinone biosynthesis C-methylase UbiE